MTIRVRPAMVLASLTCFKGFRAIILGILLPVSLLAEQGKVRAEPSDTNDELTWADTSEFDSEHLVNNLGSPTLNACYRLDWSYDKPKEIPQRAMSLHKAQHFRHQPFPYPGSFPYPYPYPYPMPRQDVYTWYCQARPVGDTKFEYSAFHSYDANRLNARTFAISRCREDYDRCTARCALAPRVCEPHFWP